MSGVVSAFAVVLLLGALLWLHQTYLRQMSIEIRGLLISIAAIMGLFFLALVGIMAESFSELALTEPFLALTEPFLGLALILLVVFGLWALIKRYWREIVDWAWVGAPLGALIMDRVDEFFADLPPDADLPAGLDRTCFLIGLALFTGALLVTVSTILWSVMQHVRNRTMLQAIRSNWHYVFGAAMTVWGIVYLNLPAGQETQIDLFDAWVYTLFIFIFFTAMAWGGAVLVRFAIWLRNEWLTGRWR